MVLGGLTNRGCAWLQGSKSKSDVSGCNLSTGTKPSTLSTSKLYISTGLRNQINCFRIPLGSVVSYARPYRDTTHLAALHTSDPFASTDDGKR